MNQIFSIKSAAVLCVVTLMMCFSTQDVSAQCRGGGGGFGAGYGGYGARSISYSSGYRGVSVNRVGGFGPSISVNVGRSAFGNSINRGGFYGGGLYGNSFNSLRTPYYGHSRAPYYGHGHRRYGF